MPNEPLDRQTFRAEGLPNITADTTIGEISRKIGRQLAFEQDTLIHQFAEKHPDVLIDDLVICHGTVSGENNGLYYRVWVEVMTEQEKKERDFQRKNGFPHGARCAFALIEALLWTLPTGHVYEDLPGWLVERARVVIDGVSRDALHRAESAAGFGGEVQYQPVKRWFELFPSKQS